MAINSPSESSPLRQHSHYIASRISVKPGKMILSSVPLYCGGSVAGFVVFAVIITGNDLIFNGPLDIKLGNLEGDRLKPLDFSQNLTLAVRQLSGIITTYLKSHFISRCISFQSQVAPTQSLSRAPAQTRSTLTTGKYILPLSWSLSEADNLGLFHFNKKSVLWVSRGSRLPF